MAKTYADLTVANATAGNAILASDIATVFTNSNNFRKPPSCEVRLSSNVAAYSSGGLISWAATEHDTDTMWAAGDPTKVTASTPGLYHVYFSGNAIQASGTTVTVGAPVIKLNGTSVTQAYFRALATGACIYAVSAIIKTTAITDYFTFAVEFEGGTTYTLSGGASRSPSNQRALVTWIGQAS